MKGLHQRGGSGVAQFAASLRRRGCDCVMGLRGIEWCFAWNKGAQ